MVKRSYVVRGAITLAFMGSCLAELHARDGRFGPYAAPLSARISPRQMNYQGFLTDDSGPPVSDTLEMSFVICDSSASGTPL